MWYLVRTAVCMLVLAAGAQAGLVTLEYGCTTRSEDGVSDICGGDHGANWTSTGLVYVNTSGWDGLMDADKVPFDGITEYVAGSLDGSPVSGSAFLSIVTEYSTPGPRRDGLARIQIEAGSRIDCHAIPIPDSVCDAEASVYNSAAGPVAASPSVQHFVLGVPFHFEGHSVVGYTTTEPGYHAEPLQAGFNVKISLFEADGVTPVPVLWDVPPSGVPEPRLSGLVLSSLIGFACFARRRRTPLS